MRGDRGVEAKEAIVLPVVAVDDVKDEEVPCREAAMSTKFRAWPPSWKVFERDSSTASSSRTRQRVLLFAQLLLFGIIVLQFIMYYRSYYLAAAAAGLVDAGMLNRQASSAQSNIPDYYQTTPELVPGLWNEFAQQIRG